MGKALTAVLMLLSLLLSVGYLGIGEEEPVSSEQEEAEAAETERERLEEEQEETADFEVEEVGLVLPMKKSEITLEESEKTEETDYRLLVNRDHPLPENYTAEIVEATGRNIKGEKQAVAALERMLAAGEREGLEFVVCSGYRTSDEQRKLYLNQIRNKLAEGYQEAEAVAEAEKYSALPGRSEHQTGLAFDIVALSYQNLDEGYALTSEAKWLFSHAEDYGFILRYPEDKEAVTGISYEPWHFRYVGCVAARAITRAGLTLEEWCGD